MTDTAPVDNRLTLLSNRHHHFVLVPDPWHYQSFANNPAVVSAISQGRVYQQPGNDGIRGGPWMKLWFSADYEGKLIGEWGLDVPPTVEVCQRCKIPNTNGAPVWCACCGVPYAQ